MVRRKLGNGAQMERKQIWKPRQARSGVLNVRGVGPDLLAEALGLVLFFLLSA